VGKAFVRIWNSLAIVRLLVPSKKLDSKSTNIVVLHCDLIEMRPFRYKSPMQVLNEKLGPLLLGSRFLQTAPLPPLSLVRNSGRAYGVILSQASVSRSNTYGYRPVTVIVREGLIIRYVPTIQG
jgi:hypothetical protein